MKYQSEHRKYEVFIGFGKNVSWIEHGGNYEKTESKSENNVENIVKNEIQSLKNVDTYVATAKKVAG